MSDDTSNPTAGLPASVHEIRGTFASDAAMQDAIAKLTLAGFDRADFSLPTSHQPANMNTPSEGAENPTTDTDMRQMRTMGTSMAGTAGAFAAAGAVVATGGLAAVAIAAAAAVGAGAALTANAAGNAADESQAETRNEAAARGELVLAVNANTPSRLEAAERILREGGATGIEGIEREGDDGALATSSWTG